MYRRCFEMRRLNQNTFLQAGLFLVWIAGLSLGFAADCFHGDAIASCVRFAAESRPDWIGCLSVNLFPLLISACAVFFLPFLFYPLCFARGFLLGLGLGAVAAVYGGAGFMMSGLLLFSAVSFTPVLLWYWCRRLERGRLSFRLDTMVCFLIGAVIAGVDFGIVAPFLREVMNF